MADTKPNLVIGVARGYDYPMLRPIVASLKKTGFAGDFVIMYNDLHDHAEVPLAADGALLFPFSPAFPHTDGPLALPERWLKEPRLHNLHIYAYRRIVEYAYLHAYGHKYNYVYLTDTRDVYFQRDPFDFERPNAVCVFLEEKKNLIKDTPANVEWITETFGEKILHEIEHNPVANAGTICMGPIPLVLEYLEVYLSVLARYGTPLTTDQAVHNYILYEKLFTKVHAYPHNTGPILNLTPDFRIAHGMIQNVNGGTPNTVHMYDRYIRTAWGRAGWDFVAKLIWRKGPQRWYMSARLFIGNLVKRYLLRRTNV
ncbi:hypothetical protein HY972_02365 [Candidatus Kaiserbacteria bacterium]|nr:hypothetical protein [Candidatus Kaiserbacteria bacterium]